MDNLASTIIAPRHISRPHPAPGLAALTALMALCAVLLAPAPQAQAATWTDLGLVQSNATSTTVTFTWDAPDSSKYSSQVIGYKLSTVNYITYVDVSLSATSYTVKLGSADSCNLRVCLGGNDLSASQYYNYTAYDYRVGYPFDSSKLAKVKAVSASWIDNTDKLSVKTSVNEKSDGTQIVAYTKSGKKLSSTTKSSAGTVSLKKTKGKVVRVRQRSYIKLSSGKTLYGKWSNWATFVPSCDVNKLSKSGGKYTFKFEKTKGATKYIVRYAYSKKSLTSSDTKKLSKLSWKTKTISKSRDTFQLPAKKGKYVYVQVLTVAKVAGKTVKAKKSYKATYTLDWLS